MNNLNPAPPRPPFAIGHDTIAVPKPNDPTSVFAPEEVVRVRYVRNTPLRKVRGRRIGIYGLFRQGAEFNMHIDDAKAAAAKNIVRIIGTYTPPAVFDIKDLPGVGEKTAETLKGIGADTKEKIYKLGVSGLVSVAGMQKKKAEALMTLLEDEFAPPEGENSEPEQPEYEDIDNEEGGDNGA
jgi:hypothetical protein